MGDDLIEITDRCVALEGEKADLLTQLGDLKKENEALADKVLGLRSAMKDIRHAVSEALREFPE